ERRGVLEAFGRSRALTKGARWSIFGLQLLILVLSWLASAVLGFVTFGIFGIRSLATAAAAASHGFPWWYLLITAILSTLLAAFHGTVQTSLYVELKNWKDGPATGALSDIF